MFYHNIIFHSLCQYNLPNYPTFIKIILKHHVTISVTTIVSRRVIDGLDVLDALEAQPVKERTYRPLNEVKIVNITIHANPMAEPLKQ